MSFSQFEHSATGARVKHVLVDSEAVRRMEAFSRAGRPALLAVARDIEKVAPALTDTEKQHVGRWVHRLLGPRGWRPTAKKRLPKGGLFTTAAVYVWIGAGEGGSGAESDVPSALARPGRDSAEIRLARARTRVAALPVRPMSVAAFIAEKRHEARREA